MKIKEKEFEEAIEELKSFVKQLGAEIRFEKGDFKGGYCILKDSKVIVINKVASLQKKIIIISQALKELGIDNLYLSPRIREIVDEMSSENEK